MGATSVDLWNKAWLARIKAETGRKGPPVRAEEVARPVGVVGEGLRSGSAPGHHKRAGGAEHSDLLSVSQLTPRISMCQGLFDELEFSDWQYEQSSVHDIPINLMRDARNQPAFSLFSWTREAA